MSENNRGLVFKIILVALGAIYFFLLRDTPNSAVSIIFKYILIVLAFCYLLLKIFTIENNLEQKLYIISIVLGLVALFAYNQLYTTGECSLQQSCPENQFCAADHLCHEFPDYTHQVTRIIVTKQISLAWSGFIIGIGLIISAIILRKTSFYPNLKKRIKKILKK